ITSKWLTSLYPLTLPAYVVLPTLPLHDALPISTQDHEFWRVEDLACFPGCAPVAREHLRALLADPANDEMPVGALLGRAYGAARSEEHTSELQSRENIVVRLLLVKKQYD